MLDIIILLVIIMGGIIGFKNGFTKQLVSFIGFFLVVILSFVLKNIVSEFLFGVLPFFKFGGIIKGVTVLNILLYEIIAFLITFGILFLIYKILLKITGLFETILKMTIILGIPSKIMGAIVGMIQYYVWSFIILYIISLPVFNVSFVDNSKYMNIILDKTPILSGVTDNVGSVASEFTELKEKYKNTKSANEFNLEALDILLKNKVTSKQVINNLVSSGKLKIKNIDTVLDKYKEE